jgi:hypothetical protein
MAVTENDVRAALRQVLIAISGLPTEQAWENLPYTPKANTPYVRETLIITSEAPASLGPPTLIEMAGEVQFDLMYPLGSKTFDAGTAADKIKKAFFPGLYINQLVYVDESRSETGVNSDQFYMKPVRVKWRAYYTQPTS